MLETGISNVYVYPLSGFGNLKALASLNYGGLVLRGLRLVAKDGDEERLWIGMPSRKKGEKWEDIYFPADKELREAMTAAIIDEYEKEMVKHRD